MSTKLETEKKEFANIDYTNTSAYRTVKAWHEIAHVYEKGGVTGVQGGIPRDEFMQLKRLRKLDSIVDPSKGPVQKVIHSMSRQIVSQKDKDGRMVPKEYLTLLVYFRGTDWADMEVEQTAYEGFFKKPQMGKVYKTGKRFDSETGADLGVIDVKGSTVEYFYEVPQDRKERKKFIDSIIENANRSFAENIKYYYKDSESGVKDSTFTYPDFTELSIEQLRDLSKRGGGQKGPGYWKDSDGKLRDRNNNLVSRPDDNKKSKGDVYQ